MGYVRKNVHFDFIGKNVLEDEGVFEVPEPNNDTLWMTQSVLNSIVTH